MVEGRGRGDSGGQSARLTHHFLNVSVLTEHQKAEQREMEDSIGPDASWCKCGGIAGNTL